jgi:hypothetical protein
LTQRGDTPLIIVYDYETGRFIRNRDGSLFNLIPDENTPKELKRNKRWVDLYDYGVIDLAYIYVENEFAEKERVEKIELMENVV